MGNGSPYLVGSAGAWNEVVMVESRWEAHRGRPEVWNGRKASSTQSLYCMKDQERRIRFTKCYLLTDSFKLCFFYQLDIIVIIFYGINALLNIRLFIQFFFHSLSENNSRPTPWEEWPYKAIESRSTVILTWEKFSVGCMSTISNQSHL